HNNMSDLRNIIEGRFGEEDDVVDIERIKFILKHTPVPPVSEYQFNELKEDVLVTEKNKSRIGNCSICLCDFDIDDEAIKLPCKHYFHYDCITTWLHKQSATCANCRYPLPTSNAEYDMMIRLVREHEKKNGETDDNNDDDRRHYSKTSMYS
ncbi:hypothetical protein DICPUDRAFT_29618, partial [Dictyostelium purpureum]